jgi:hypothetical protein
MLLKLSRRGHFLLACTAEALAALVVQTETAEAAAQRVRLHQPQRKAVTLEHLMQQQQQ